MTRPSLADYGTHDESAFPHLWGGVVGAWAPCLGPTGLRLHDFSRRANWGTLTNMDAATDWVVDGGQYALDLGSTNDYVETSFRRAGGQVQLAFSIWIKRAVDNFFFVGDASGNSGLAVEFYPSTIYFNFASPQTTYSQLSFTPDNNWHHFAFLYNCFGSSNTERAKIFIDGSERVSTYPTPTPTSLSAPSQNFAIGIRYWSLLENAAIFDDCIFWNRTPTQNEISELYQIGRGGMYAPRRRRRAYSYRPTGLRRRLILTGQT